MQPPLQRFLERCHAQFAPDENGSVAQYIPELGKADPSQFGIAVATIDGHVYEVGDSRAAFTIQSVSKTFVFALALDTLGAPDIEAAIGVEPSGEAFNSIRLTADNRPFNPMVNAGAIACSGLIHERLGGGAFDLIHTTFNRFAGRELAIDDAVFASERATGDRNRAIAWLLHNYSVLRDDVDAVLDVYFRQCSVLVTARDLAIMAGTLANAGVNPVTGERVVSAYAVARTLSVMTSSGMYDYAGEWIYRVGIPAKSGVGGGIIASLPAQLGLGTFSPRLDSHGNSVRGLKVCEALSSHFDLHLLNCSDDVRTCIIADYDISNVSSRRSRQPHEQQILEQHHDQLRVLELVGALTFATMDYVSRRLVDADRMAQFLILDFRRVPNITTAAARLLSDILAGFTAAGRIPIVAGLDADSSVWQAICEWPASQAGLRRFKLLDDAIEWAEDQIVYRHGGFERLGRVAELGKQALLAGLPQDEVAELADACTPRSYQIGQRIVAVGEPALSLFFLQSGLVSVKFRDGTRLASLAPGMVFGEMALIERERSADVYADTAVQCLELRLDAYAGFASRHPPSAERMMRNLAILLADRLILANARVDVLSAY